MFTTIDKAIAAFLGGLLSFLMLKFGIDLGISETMIASVSSFVAMALTYLVPNKTT